MIPARERLPGDQGRIVLEAQPDRLRGRDLRGAGGAHDPIPAEARQLETVGNPHSWADMTGEAYAPSQRSALE